jgi:hypothetical protein
MNGRPEPPKLKPERRKPRGASVDMNEVAADTLLAFVELERTTCTGLTRMSCRVGLRVSLYLSAP